MLPDIKMFSFVAEETKFGMQNEIEFAIVNLFSMAS